MLPPHAKEWMGRAEIDYIGPFVKAWAAFNAWYRSASGAPTERQMLDFSVGSANSRLRRRVLPLLSGGSNIAEADRLKQAICDLQLALDRIHFEVCPKGRRERVSLRQVCIKPKQLQKEHWEKNGHRYSASKIAGGAIEISVVVVRNNSIKFTYTQQMYNPLEVYADPAYTSALSGPQQLALREFYDRCNPRPMADLVQGGGATLMVSTMQFQCSPEELLSGVIETLYAMRNALLHGEVDPDQQVLACYEPAYRIVMCFLGELI